MKKPKYYLRPYHMVDDHNGITKAIWEEIRKKNKKPYSVNTRSGPTWAIPDGPNVPWLLTKANNPLTQRLFIEQKEESK